MMAFDLGSIAILNIYGVEIRGTFWGNKGEAIKLKHLHKFK